MEESVSCVGPYIKKAHLQCKTGYFNEENITLQTINCNDNGEWSDEPLSCIPICTDFSSKLELLDYNQIKFPTAYVEFSRKNPVEGKINKFPGIILSERQILTPHFNYTYSEEYHLIIYKSGNKLKKYDLDINKRSSSSDEEYSILGTYSIIDFGIKYDSDTKPACKNISNILEIPKLNRYVIANEIADKYTHQPDSCYVPKVDSNKVQVNCRNYRAVKCETRTTVVELRCQVGYKNYNLDPNTDILSKCTEGKWEVFGVEEDCQLICGHIAEDHQPYSSKLLYKGNSTKIVNAPWHVGINANNTGTSTFVQICGGSIIHSNVVISAAHCFYDDAYNTLYSPINYLIGGGKTYRSIGASDEFASYIEIKDIHIPIHYQSTPVRNDIAVLILQNHFEYSPRIKPICIDWDPYNNYDTTIRYEIGLVVGWGATSRNVTSSTKLLKLLFETLDNDECKELVHPNFRCDINGDRFCAKSIYGGAACQGDSGGGFIVHRDVQNRYHLLGVVSGGIDIKKYCSDGFITMFTNVKLYKDFIQQAISKNRLSLPRMG